MCYDCFPKKRVHALLYKVISLWKKLPSKNSVVYVNTSNQLHGHYPYSVPKTTNKLIQYICCDEKQLLLVFWGWRAPKPQSNIQRKTRSQLVVISICFVCIFNFQFLETCVGWKTVSNFLVVEKIADYLSIVFCCLPLLFAACWKHVEMSWCWTQTWYISRTRIPISRES